MIAPESGKLMPNWIIIIAVLCVAVGIALTVYALFRVANALRQAEDGKALRDTLHRLEEAESHRPMAS